MCEGRAPFVVFGKAKVEELTSVSQKKNLRMLLDHEKSETMARAATWTEMILFQRSCFTIILREGNGTPLQYSCLENPMDGGAW